MSNERKKILFLLGFLPNPRMNKRISVAKQVGKVSLVCWDRGANMQLPPDDSDIIIYIIKETLGKSIVSRYISNIKLQKKAISILKRERPAIIHVQGLDMLGIACRYKHLYDNKVKIIYEVADLHTLIVDKQHDIIHKLVQWYLKRKDRKCCQVIDLLIVTSDYYYRVYFNAFVDMKKYIYLPNLPNLDFFANYEKSTLSEFTIGYIGIVRYKEQLIHLINICKRDNISLLIAGYEQGENIVERECEGASSINWIGRFDYEKEAARLYEKCKVIYAVYDADMSNVRVALPNKLYESIYCELPIIVAKNTYLASLVEEWGVGIAINHKEPSELEAAIQRLRDPIQYSVIVDNCKKHKEDINLQKYNDLYKEKLCELIK